MSTNKENEQQFSTKEVRVVPYDPQWKTEFEKIRAMIQSYIGDYLETIEHVGSTSVEGLGAKPVIDLDAVLKHKEDLPKVIEQLGKYGYVHQGDLGLPGREAFFRPRDYDEQEKSVIKYHFYVCHNEAKPYLEHIAFRDYLTQHGIFSTIRASRGEDIFAACGMLSTAETQKRKNSKHTN